jgi:hypothetical protein
MNQKRFAIFMQVYIKTSFSGHAANLKKEMFFFRAHGTWNSTPS